MHQYLYYSDLQTPYFKRIRLKKLPEILSDGTPCEYYSAVRTSSQPSPGFSSWHYKYDVNSKGEIIRVAVRFPLCLKDGQSVPEDFRIFPKKFSKELCSVLLKDYVNLHITKEEFRKKYPWSHSDSAEAYEMLKDHMTVYYASEIKNLKLVQMYYRKVKLTFCFDLSGKGPKLFDVLTGEKEYDRLLHTLERCGFRSMNISMNACRELYTKLKQLPFKTNIFLDPYFFPLLYDQCAQASDLPGTIKDDLTCRKNDMMDWIEYIYGKKRAGRLDHEEAEERFSDEYYYLGFLTDHKNNPPAILTETLTDLCDIADEDEDFYNGVFYADPAFLIPLDHQIIENYIQKFAAKRFSPERMACAMLYHLENAHWYEDPYHATRKRNDDGMTFAPHFGGLLKF